jgi:hypothetical protein
LILKLNITEFHQNISIWVFIPFYISYIFTPRHLLSYAVPTVLSPPRPGTNWADWSDAMGREMYLRRALDRLNFEYPSDDAS